MVIISSFYNEEYLLPWWLEHHKKIFKHGILFDYFSTDRSVDIIKRICPDWEIRKTRNKDWDFEDNTQEFMDTERQINGYKAVIYTTEFLVGEMPEFPIEPTIYALPIFRLVDDKPEKKPTYDKPLVEQKYHGFIDRSSKRRFLHNYPDGRYGVGHHKTGHKTIESSLSIYKYVYSPWTEEFINRKLSMKDYVNPENTKRGWGLHHTWDRNKLQKEYERAINTNSRQE